MNKLYTTTLIAAAMALGASAQTPASKEAASGSAAQTLLGAPGSTDRAARMEALGKQAGTFHAPLGNGRGGVTNDDCSTAESITVLTLGDCATGATVGNNAGASNDTLQPTCDPGSVIGYQDVWYTFNSGINGSVIITLTADDDSMDWAFVLYDGCGGNEIRCAVTPTDPVSVAVTASTDYYLRMYSNLDWGIGGPFTLCVAGTGAPPDNDACSGAVNQDLAIGSSVTFTGDNTGATDNEDLGQPALWEQFTTTECANLELTYCGTSPAFGNGFVNLFFGCPQAGFIEPVGFDDTTCADGNFTIFYEDVPAGTYYYAVMQDAANNAIGEYSITVTASACIPHTEYCTPNPVNGTTGGDYIGSFQLGDINYTGPNDVNYVDNTSMTTDLAIDGTYTATITGGSYAPDAYAAWIDYNNDFLFSPIDEKLGEVSTVSDAAEVVTITFTIPAGTTLGAKRLRVRGVYNTGGGTSACTDYSYGETEDYTVNIVLSSGISQQGHSSLTVYPNPSKGDLTISGAELSGKVDFQLTDMTGRVVYVHQQAMSANQPVTLPLNGKLAQGTYTLRLISANGISSRPVMIK